MHPTAGRKRWEKSIGKYRYLYLMLIPVMIWYLIFCYGPMYGLVTAFQDYNMNRGVLGSAFVGLKHFRTLMGDKYFWRAFGNTLTIAFYRIVFVFPVGILLALLLNELRGKRFQKTIQTAIYLNTLYNTCWGCCLFCWWIQS